MMDSPKQATKWKFDVKELFSKENLLIQLSLIGIGFLLILYRFFSVKVFVDIFSISTAHLAYVQFAFLIWNAVNDPLIGYVQDVGCGVSWLMDRRKVMVYAGPLWAAATLLFWFPIDLANPLIIAFHYFIALFVYDTFMTLICSAYCGITVEFGGNHKGRVNIVVLGEFFAILSGLIIFPIDYFSQNLRNYGTFQICAVITCCISGVLMFISGCFLKPPKLENAELHHLNDAEETAEEQTSVLQAIKIGWQIIKESRFLCVTLADFFRNLRSVFDDQFVMIFVEALLSKNGFMPVGGIVLSVYYIFVRTCGRVLFLLLFIPIQKFGAHPTMMTLNFIALVSSVFMLFIGKNAYFVLAAYILIENALCRCGAHGLYLVLTGEVIDTDTARHKRKSPLSTLIFTIKALFNKPAEQLAPIITMFLLDFGGYSQYKAFCGIAISQKTNSTANPIDIPTITSYAPDNQCETLFSTMFYVIVLLPLVCLLLESVFLISDFKLKKKLGPILATSEKHHTSRKLSICSLKSVTRMG